MKTVTLKPKHLQTLTAIQRHIAAHGMPPTVRELLKPLRLRSLDSVHDRIRALRNAGALVASSRFSNRTIAPARGVQVVVMYE